MQTLNTLLRENPGLKVVNIFLPLRQQSVEGMDTNSAQYAMQVWQETPTKFPQVHDRLMDKNGMHNARSLRDVVEATDTMAELEASAGQADRARENHRAFTDLGLRGTPSLIIGDEIRQGYVNYDQLKPLLESAAP